MRLTICLLSLLCLPATLVWAQSAEPPVTSPPEIPQHPAVAPSEEVRDMVEPSAAPATPASPSTEETAMPAPAIAPAEAAATVDAVAPVAQPVAALSSTPASNAAQKNEAVQNEHAQLDLRVVTIDAQSKPVKQPPSKHPLLAIDDELFLGAIAITGWGIHHWKWFKSLPKMKIEHGFTSRSSTGGSDKTGHFFAGYIVGDMLAWRLRDMGYDRVTSALWGATGSMALMTWIEMGDSTSHYGWSFEDMLADFVGVTTSALLGIYPVLDDLLDFRVQYWPTPGFLKGKDVVADYSGMKHLMAIKLSGIPFVRDTPLRFLEAQIGFYSRGFRSFDVDPERRVLYVGIGVTATEVLAPVLKRIPGVRKAAPPILTFFEYYQPPILGQEVAKAVFETPRTSTTASGLTAR